MCERERERERERSTGFCLRGPAGGPGPRCTRTLHTKARTARKLVAVSCYFTLPVQLNGNTPAVCSVSLAKYRTM